MTEEFIEEVKETKENTSFTTTRDDEICKCPNCGSSIVEGKYGYGCANWKNCKVNIYFNAIERLGGKKITKTQAKELLTLNKTKKQTPLVSAKSGKEYQAYLTYSFDENRKYPNQINISFD